MKLTLRPAQLTIVLVLGLVPALAMASTSHSAGRSSRPGSAPHGSSHTPSSVVGPSASPAKQAKAYGFYCQTESKQHVSGTPGSPYSACVKGAAQAVRKTI